jgi:hypothetical protein
VIRLDYGDPTLGTCKETVEGGNHFRYWIQSGGEADRYYFYTSSSASLDVAHLFISLQSGAVFMAVSYELPEQCEHVVTRFPLLYSSYANLSMPKWIMTSFSMGVCSLFLAFFCDTKPRVHLAKLQPSSVRLFPVRISVRSTHEQPKPVTG